MDRTNIDQIGLRVITELQFLVRSPTAIWSTIFYFIFEFFKWSPKFQAAYYAKICLIPGLCVRKPTSFPNKLISNKYMGTIILCLEDGFSASQKNLEGGQRSTLVDFLIKEVPTANMKNDFNRNHPPKNWGIRGEGFLYEVAQNFEYIAF